jgi:hypothetical protein
MARLSPPSEDRAESRPGANYGLGSRFCREALLACGAPFCPHVSVSRSLSRIEAMVI